MWKNQLWHSIILLNFSFLFFSHITHCLEWHNEQSWYHRLYKSHYNLKKGSFFRKNIGKSEISTFFKNLTRWIKTDGTIAFRSSFYIIINALMPGTKITVTLWLVVNRSVNKVLTISYPASMNDTDPYSEQWSEWTWLDSYI